MKKVLSRTYNSANDLKFSISALLYNSTYYLIIGVLLFSGIVKIIDPLPLIKTLEATKIFSFVSWGNEINIFIATTLPMIEIGLALLLVLKIKLKVVLPITLLFFMSFLVFSIYGYYLGLATDCGCFGDFVKSEFGKGMVIRNFIFLAIIMNLLKQYFGKTTWPVGINKSINSKKGEIK